MIQSKSKGMITSEQMTNIRSKASMTNFASSLREDDLMISSSLVDPNEKSMKQSPTKLAAKIAALGIDKDAKNLIIAEESSSLKSVSPLTENSMSRKSH